MRMGLLGFAMAGMLCVTAATLLAQIQPNDFVQEVTRLSEVAEKLKNQLREAQMAGRHEDANKIGLELRRTMKMQDDLIMQMRQQWQQAKAANNTEEAGRLGKLIEEGAKQGEYYRSLEEGRPKPAPFDVVISEVCYWPKDGDTEWVELENLTDAPVDITRWVLLDGQTLFIVIPKLSPVPAKGFVVVQFDGSGEVPKAFDADNKCIVHTPGGVKGDLLGNRGGHLALYAPGKDGSLEPGISTIRSYVAWGLSPGVILHDALTAHRWSQMDAVAQGTTDDKRYGAQEKLLQGGTIELGDSGQSADHGMNQWNVCTHSDVSPDSVRTRPRTPEQYLPDDGWSTGDDGIITLSCLPMERGARYHFQVCFDRECTKVFLDAHDQLQFSYILQQPVPVDTVVYWRVRCVHADGSISAWSPVRALRRMK